MEEGFETGSKKAFKYGIMTNSRSSNKLDKMDMIKTVANLVTNLDQGHSVDLKNQDKTVILELYKAKVGISVVSDYYRFCKVSYAPSSSSRSELMYSTMSFSLPSRLRQSERKKPTQTMLFLPIQQAQRKYLNKVRLLLNTPLGREKLKRWHSLIRLHEPNVHWRRRTKGISRARMQWTSLSRRKRRLGVWRQTLTCQ